MSPRAYVPSEQQRAFELALSKYLEIDPGKFSLRGWETSWDTGHVDLRAFVPADDLLFMFNNGRVPDEPNGDWGGDAPEWTMG